MKNKLAIIRVPYLSRYNQLDVKEEPIISSLASYLNGVKVNYKIFDFHLDRTLDIDKIINYNAKYYVISLRATGIYWKYAYKVSQHILQKLNNSIVVFYGQTGKLKYWGNLNPERVLIIKHDERELAHRLGLPINEISFENELSHFPYSFALFNQLRERKNLFKATIETTRGCHYACKFCFINHGQNYSKRFIRRPIEAIINDMKEYYKAGIKQFWFYDSEFIGGVKSQYDNVKNLLLKIKSEFKGQVEIMIYNRADTLERFNNYQLLYDAGVRCILLGIESFANNDLKNMRKGQYGDVTIKAIKNLRKHKIFCRLSFILFNKSTTVASIQENIEGLKKLYNEPDFIYLGQTISFTYSFESDWMPNKYTNKLSNKTRLIGSTSSTFSPAKGIAFNSKLEPLAEVYRVINYEQIRKICELNLGKESIYKKYHTQIHHWATILNLFTINIMQVALDDFKNGFLNLDNVNTYKIWVYTSFKKFNKSLLPPSLSETITDLYGQYKGDWNGWEAQIPTLS